MNWPATSTSPWSLLLLVGLAAAGTSCEQRKSPPVPLTIHVARGAPIEAQLASRDTNSDEVPSALVSDFDRVLTALETRCVEPRSGTPSLSTIAEAAVDAAETNGYETTRLQALRALEGSIHEGADMKIDCSDAARRLFQPEANITRRR